MLHYIYKQPGTTVLFSTLLVGGIEETVVNVGHMASRFWKPACVGLWVVLVNVCDFN